jgi:hypothetical protein
LGWQAADRTYIVDTNALTDPLLARLPAMQEPPWRIGHFTRVPPPGYLATLVLGENRIGDPGVAAYYDDLRLVTRGRLWTGERLRAILRLNLKRRPELGNADLYLAPARYETPARRHYPAAWFEESQEERTMPGTDSFALYWEEAGTQGLIEMIPAPTGDYDVQLARGGIELGRFVVTRGGEASATIGIPPDLIGEGYDTVRFFPRGFAEEQRFKTIRRRTEGDVPATEHGIQEEAAE